MRGRSFRRWAGAATAFVAGLASLAGLLGAAPAATASPSAATRARATGSPPAARYTTTPAPGVVDVARLASPGGPRRAEAPVRHRHQPAYERAKARAASHPSSAPVEVARQAPGASTSSPAPPAGRTVQSPSGADSGVTPGPFLPLVTDQDEVSWFGSGQDLEPPDTQVAVGPSDVVEFVNSTGSVWSRTGTLLEDFDLNKFFPVPPADAGFGAFDTQVLYDPQSSRWFASVSASNINTTIGQVFLAVSQTSDPTGSWWTYEVASTTSGIFDQPFLGTSNDKVVLSWNDFSGSNFTGEETWVLDKAQVTAGTKGTEAELFANDTSRYRLVPARSETSSTTEWVVYNDSDCTNLSCGSPGNPSAADVGVIAVTGNPTTGNVASAETYLPITPTQVPPSAAQPCPSGQSCLPVDTGDDRFQGAVYSNGVLWTGGDDSCEPTGSPPAQACLRLDEINVSSTPTLAVDKDVGTPGMDLYYPAEAVDGSGDLGLVFSQSSTTVYPEVAATARDAAGSATTLLISVLQPGQATYQGSAGCNGSCGRWGDYSAAQVDPTNSSDFWFAGEYSGTCTSACSASLNWSTGVGEATFATGPASGDGLGAVSASPAQLLSGSTGDTVGFTYTVPTGGIDDGEVTLAVPAGWPAPSTSPTAPGYVTSPVGTVAVSGPTIEVSGLTLGAGTPVDITYGSKAGGGPGLTAPGGYAGYPFDAEEKSTSTGTLTPLSSSPTVTLVASPDGSGTMTAAPTTVTAGSTGNTLAFTYTAATGGLDAGTVSFAVPSGWPAPSTAATAPGYVTSPAGTVSVSGSTVEVSGVTLAGGQTLTVDYGSTAGGGPGATAPTTAGRSVFATQAASTASGTLTTIADPQPAVTVAPGSPSKLAFTGQPPPSVTAGSAFTTSVSVEDSYGNVVTSDAATSVDLAITSGTGAAGAALTCATDPATASSGVAAFNCSVNDPGSGYTLTATAAGLTPAVSSAFTVSAPSGGGGGGGGGGSSSGVGVVMGGTPTGVAAGASGVPLNPITATETSPGALASGMYTLSTAAGTLGGSPTVTASGLAVATPAGGTCPAAGSSSAAATLNGGRLQFCLVTASTSTPGALSVSGATFDAPSSAGAVPVTLTSSSNVSYQAAQPPITVVYDPRVAGYTADDTAAAAAETLYPNGQMNGGAGGAVILASDSEYQDALSASFLGHAPLSYQDRSTGGTGQMSSPVPILLNPVDPPAAGESTTAAAQAIETLGATSVYVVGGSYVVSAAVVSGLQAMGLQVFRVAGFTAEQTAAMVASQTVALSTSQYSLPATPGAYGMYNSGASESPSGPTSGSVPTAILADAGEFQDALAASPLAYADTLPVLLNAPGAGLDPYAQQAIQKLGVEQVIVVGGSAAVTDQAVSQLEALGVSVLRVAGTTFDATAAELASFELDAYGAPGTAQAGLVDGLSSTATAYSGPALTLGTSRGDAYQDALSSSQVLGAGGPGRVSPLLLTGGPDVLPAATAAFLSGHGTGSPSGGFLVYDSTGGNVPEHLLGDVVFGGVYAQTPALVASELDDIAG